MVCLTAIAHGARDFDALAERIKDRFEVIRLDWPGHGRSGDDRQDASAARYAQLLTGFMDQLGIVGPIVVGNSIGGAAAILSAARRPVTALVVCDSGGLVAVDATVRRICGAFERFFAAGARGAPWFKAAYALYYRYIVLPSPAAAEQRSRIIAAGYESAEVLRQAWHNFGQPEADIRAELRGLTVPVWFAWARHDRVIPLSFCRPAIDAAQRGSLTTFDAGHATFLEQPDAFAEGFLAFAKDHAATPFRLRPAA